MPTPYFRAYAFDFFVAIDAGDDCCCRYAIRLRHDTPIFDAAMPLITFAEAPRYATILLMISPYAMRHYLRLFFAAALRHCHADTLMLPWLPRHYAPYMPMMPPPLCRAIDVDIYAAITMPLRYFSPCR